MARNRRPLTTFNLAFIDAMACGLGAVILLFMIIHHATEVRASQMNREIAEQASVLETQVQEKRQASEQLAAAIEETIEQLRAARARAEALQQQLVEEVAGEAGGENTKLAQLMEQVRSLQDRVETLRAQQAEAGDATRAREGEGRRQYLSGLKVTGRNILILVDASASMLDETIVGVIRRRNMGQAEQRTAWKWRWTLDAADWISTQVPASSSFQIYVFNTEVESVLAGTTGQWLPAAGGGRLDEAVSALRQRLPAGGTSLHRAFAAAARLSPQPDSIYLLTDGLPTQGPTIRAGSVSSAARMNLFRQAVTALPRGPVVHTVLFPMEGDPEAPGAFWQLALARGGSFLSPSRDWP